MKVEFVVLLFAALLFFGCTNGGGSNVNVCPPNCVYGCLADNITCAPPPSNLCENVTCPDRCEDENTLNTNGQCNPETGECMYRKNICPFGCENNACRMAPRCPAICPFGCEPGTDVCRSAMCPEHCRYGCIPGTIQCNFEPPSSGIKNGDFEEGYVGWDVKGIAFGSSPSEGAVANARGLYLKEPYSGYSGAYFASSYLPNMDKRAMGNITSEPFFINKRYLEFLVIGQLSAHIYVELIVNKTVVYHLEPDNPYPPFQRVTWDVSNYVGKIAVIKVVDASNRQSIEVDDFRLVDIPSPKAGEPYVEPYGRFSIVPPLNWFVGQAPMRGQVFIYGSKENNFTNQIIVISEEVNRGETTELYFAKGKTGLELLLQNYSKIAEQDVVINGLNAKQIDYTYTSMGIPLKTREVFLVHGGVGYKISATTAVQSFERYSKKFDETIKSFKIIGG